KVSARDVTELLSELREEVPSVEESTAGSSNLILRLIDDEFAEIRSLDDEGDDGPATGSLPLDALVGGSGVPGMSGYDPSAPLSLSEFGGNDLSPAPPGEASEPTPVPAPGSAPMARPAHPTGPSPAPRQRSVALPLVAVLFVLLGGAGAAYYWFMVLGNTL
ncbi:MAG: hypothetical protein AAF721_42540, partial [Myxococcota bacterium]